MSHDLDGNILQVGDVPIESSKSGIDIGTVNIALDSSSVDSFIARLERATAAFKAEWNKV